MADDKELQYISALQDFSKSLGYLVDSIKKQVKSEQDGFKDSLAASKEQVEYMMEMAKDLKVVSETTASTKSNTEQILDIVKGIKKEKKSGIWDKLSGAKDKTKSVAEGIKTIALMAGAILAIGTAFKIIGEVDFTSVLALSIALPLMATAFNMVGESVSDPKEAASIAFSMVIMSAGVAASGAILSLMPSLTFMQMVSVVAVSIAMGVAMYALAEAADELSPKRISSLYKMIPAMPLAAAGIALSGLALSNMPLITMPQFLSAIGVGVAMGASMIPLAIAANALGNNVGKMYGLAILMPVMAGAIYASALILQDVPEIDFINTIKASLGITAASVIFGAGLWALDKLGVNIGMAAKGVIAMTIVAGGILATSHILAAGNYSNAPTLDWSLNAGAALLGGGLLAAGMGMFIGQIVPGVFAMTLVAGGIMATSHILAMGDYSNGPSLDWAMGTGATLAGFGLTSVAMGIVMLTGVGAIALVAGIGGMALVAGGLVEVSKIIKGGDYSGGPSIEWSQGVGTALMTFANTLSIMSPGIVDMMFGESLDGRIKQMVALGDALKLVSIAVKGGTYTGGPSAKWSEGVGIAMMSFVNTLDALNPGVIDMMFGESMNSRIKQIVDLGGALKQVSFKVKGGTYTGGPSKEWAEGVGLSLMYFANALDEIKPGIFDRLLGDSMEGNIAGLVSLGGALHSIGEAVGKDNSVYSGGPDKRWAEGVGLSLAAFAGALDVIKPGFFASLLGDTLQSQVDGMITIAGALPRIGRAIGKDTSMYQGGPTEAWAKGVGGSVTAFANAIVSLSDEGIDAEDLSEWLPAIMRMAPVLGTFGKLLNGIKFDSYPSTEWVDGITKFMSSFSDLDVVDDAEDASKQIMMLSRSYINLAGSINLLGKSLQSVKAAPDLTGIYGGLVTLSLVDSDNLESTLDTLNNKKDEFQNVLSMIQAQSQVKIDENTFAFNKDKSTPETTQAKSNATGLKASSQVSEPIKTQPKATIEQPKTDKQEALLSQLVQLMGQMTSVLSEIADNTSTKIHDSDIITN